MILDTFIHLMCKVRDEVGGDAEVLIIGDDGETAYPPIAERWEAGKQFAGLSGSGEIITNDAEVVMLVADAEEDKQEGGE